mgnify:CR=1 FL=1
MPIIDRKKPEHAHYPKAIDGFYLLEEDEKGYHCCDPIVAKYAKDAPILERIGMGYQPYLGKLKADAAELDQFPAKTQKEIRDLIIGAAKK